jgi:hypothetical protein
MTAEHRFLSKVPALTHGIDQCSAAFASFCGPLRYLRFSFLFHTPGAFSQKGKRK